MLRPLLLTLLLLVCPLVLADKYPTVAIPPEQRVLNYTGVQCCYSSLETLARYHKIESLYGLTDRYKGMSSPVPICRLLYDRNIPHVCRFPSDDRTETLAFLQKACYSGYGALIGINGNHACVLVGLDNDTARIIPIKRQSNEIQTIPTPQFLRMFHGWAVVIWKDRKGLHPVVSKSPPTIVRQPVAAPVCET